MKTNCIGVIYRGKPGDRITADDYTEAIRDLRDASTQLHPDGRHCSCCGDSGHEAWQCHHNPLVMARRAASRQEEYRCYHCGEAFSGKAAAEHFGDDRSNPVPTTCQQLTSDRRMLDAMIVMLEKYGIHRNHHNGASIKMLWEKAQVEARACNPFGVGP